MITQLSRALEDDKINKSNYGTLVRVLADIRPDPELGQLTKEVFATLLTRPLEPMMRYQMRQIASL